MQGRKRPQAIGELRGYEGLGVIEHELKEMFHAGGPSAKFTSLSQQIPYQPMGPPRKQVSQERMREILAKHTGKPVPLPKPEPEKPQLPAGYSKQQALNEMWLIKRLGQHGRHVDAGVTDPDIRRERMREAITAIGPRVILGRSKDGERMSYAEAFEKLYRVPFELKEHAA